jgi:hypothetical protein
VMGIGSNNEAANRQMRAAAGPGLIHLVILCAFMMTVGLLVTPAAASAIPAGSTNAAVASRVVAHTTPNPTCGSSYGLGVCIQAYSNGLLFSYTGATNGSQVVGWTNTSNGNHGSQTTNCEGPNFSVAETLTQGEYSGGASMITPNYGQIPYQDFDLVVGGSTPLPSPSCTTPPPVVSTKCNGGAVPPITGLAASYAASGGAVNGYWKTDAAGGVSAFGSANSTLGSMGGCPLNKPVTGIVATPDGGGYWLVASDGGTFAFGDATFHGSTGSMHLNAPVVSLAPTQDNGGYWLVASDGGIFSFGDAQFYGSTGSMRLNAPIVGMAATFDGGGYWLVASDGGIFAFGDAQFYGSAGSIHLNQPIVGMVPTKDGSGYLLVAKDGGVFAYGDAQFSGSTGSNPYNPANAAVGVVPDTQLGNGSYWLEFRDGTTVSYGGAPNYG